MICFWRKTLTGAVTGVECLAWDVCQSVGLYSELITRHRLDMRPFTASASALSLDLDMLENNRSTECTYPIPCLCWNRTLSILQMLKCLTIWKLTEHVFDFKKCLTWIHCGMDAIKHWTKECCFRVDSQWFGSPSNVINSSNRQMLIVCNYNSTHVYLY